MSTAQSVITGHLTLTTSNSTAPILTFQGSDSTNGPALSANSSKDLLINKPIQLESASGPKLSKDSSNNLVINKPKISLTDSSTTAGISYNKTGGYIKIDTNALNINSNATVSYDTDNSAVKINTSTFNINDNVKISYDSTNQATKISTSSLNFNGYARVGYDSDSKSIKFTEPALNLNGALIKYNNNVVLVDKPIQLGTSSGPLLYEMDDAGSNHELFVDKCVILGDGIQFDSTAGPKVSIDSNSNIIVGGSVKIGGSTGPLLSNDDGKLAVNNAIRLGSQSGPYIDNDTGKLLVGGSGGLEIGSTSGPVLTEMTDAGSNHELFINKGIIVGGVIQVGNNTGPKLSKDSSARLSISAPIVLEHKTGSTDDSQTITPTMTSSTSGKSAGAGVEFSGDAQFSIPSGSGTVKVRISDLYDPDANIAQIANILSAVCRTIYTYTNEGQQPTKDPSTGIITPNDYGPLQTDKDWIGYFATRNLDNGQAPPINPSSN